MGIEPACAGSEHWLSGHCTVWRLNQLFDRNMFDNTLDNETEIEKSEISDLCAVFFFILSIAC